MYVNMMYRNGNTLICFSIKCVFQNKEQCQMMERSSECGRHKEMHKR